MVPLLINNISQLLCSVIYFCIYLLLLYPELFYMQSRLTFYYFIPSFICFCLLLFIQSDCITFKAYIYPVPPLPICRVRSFPGGARSQLLQNNKNKRDMPLPHPWPLAHFAAECKLIIMMDKLCPWKDNCNPPPKKYIKNDGNEWFL